MGLEDKYPSPPVLGGAHKREWCRGKGLGDGTRGSVNEEESEFGGEISRFLPAYWVGGGLLTVPIRCVACVRLRAGHRDDQRDRMQGHAVGSDSGRSQGESTASLGDGGHFFLRSSPSPSPPSRLPLRHLPPDGLDASIIRCTGRRGKPPPKSYPLAEGPYRPLPRYGRPRDTCDGTRWGREEEGRN
jgi:hypothetical protein